MATVPISANQQPDRPRNTRKGPGNLIENYLKASAIASAVAVGGAGVYMALNPQEAKRMGEKLFVEVFSRADAIVSDLTEPKDVINLQAFPGVQIQHINRQDKIQPDDTVIVTVRQDSPIKALNFSASAVEVEYAGGKKEQFQIKTRPQSTGPVYIAVEFDPVMEALTQKDGGIIFANSASKPMERLAVHVKDDEKRDLALSVRNLARTRLPLEITLEQSPKSPRKMSIAANGIDLLLQGISELEFNNAKNTENVIRAGKDTAIALDADTTLLFRHSDVTLKREGETHTLPYLAKTPAR